MMSEEETQPQVLIIGAGAAGLWCAARAAEQGLSVVVVEKTQRSGTKILASGGSRCNITTTLGPRDAGHLFGTRGERFLRSALGRLTPLDVRERLRSLGVETREAPLEKVFPASDRARDVRDAMEQWARDAGARFEFSRAVTGVERVGELWRVQTEAGTNLEAPNLVLATGGQSYPRMGTTGDAYAWLQGLDLPLVEPVPALVPLRSPAEWVWSLTGISVQDNELRLENAEGRILGRRSRPIIFTHQGVSGPGAMDLSEHVARAKGQTCWLLVDLLPMVDREALRERLIEAAAAKRAPTLSRVVASLAKAPLAKRLLTAVAAQAGLPQADPAANTLAKRFRHEWIEALKGLRVPVDGTLDYDKAEVTAGGLDLRAVDPKTMTVRGNPGLFAIGELLDLQGPIGGLNFQAAFATAEACAATIAQS
jgi:predicted Rossmann fold flavoprotein